MVLKEWERKDWEWWLKYLDAITPISIIDMVNPILPVDEMYFDGATNGSRECGWCPGIGVWYKGHWISMRVPPNYTATFNSHNTEYEKEYAIPHFEMLAIVIGLWNFRKLIGRRVSLWLRTDSKHVEAALKTKNSGDEFLMSAVRWLGMFASNHDLRLYVDYINTKHNTLADLASRFEIDPCGSCETEPRCMNGCGFMEKAAMECRERGWTLRENLIDIDIPDIHKW